MRRLLSVLAAAAALAAPLAAVQEPGGGESRAESRTAHLRRMYETNRCTFGDAVRAVAGLVDGEPSAGAYSTLAGELAEKGVVDTGWGLAEDDKLTKGTLAFMLCRALGIKGGVTMRLVGVTRRYALKECLHVGLIESGGTDDYVSGRELLDVLQRAATWKAEGSLDSLRK